MRRKNTEDLSEVIDQYLKSIGADVKIKEIRLKRSWEEIMGRNIALKTEKIVIKDGIFYVKIPSSIVKNELMLIRQGIIDKLNDFAGEKLIRGFKAY